ncbi:MAG: hypothetical protein QOF78_3205 [Phycisphaerales bacterium]|jgi:hypothetical protein|nr:hypothetical protein [Phycisphaerales bacterium]
MSITDFIGEIPYRMALAGGWIDQPFVSRFNPKPPGSMVVVSLEPIVRFMERAGIATGTRNVARRIWNDKLPVGRSRAELVRELYHEENKNLIDKSGSQDMIGTIYPGISRLDYDYTCEEGVFPKHIESTNDPQIVAWLERVIHLIPVAPRPPGYNPVGVKNLDAEAIAALGQSGKDCYDAILARDIKRLGQSMKDCTRAYLKILPHTLLHPTLSAFDYVKFQEDYQARYAGAMFSGCGGGYMIVASEDERVDGAFKIKIRAERK